MASHAAQGPQSRRLSRQHVQPADEAQLASHSSGSGSDSQNSPFVLNDSQSTPGSANARAKEPSTSTTAAAAQAAEPQICWICQQDATDDTPETSIWRRPCPCSLTAHDECLLEWITSQEAPKPGEIATTKNIVCPVCQAEIKIARPRDFLVMLADRIQKAAKGLMVPTALSAVMGVFYSGFLVYGLNTMHLVFGREESRRLLMPSSYDIRARTMAENSVYGRAISEFFMLYLPFMPTIPGMKLMLGMPLIAPGLVLSRTRFADQIFAILPISYFIFNPTRRSDLASWPPSAALTFAVLPYLRTTYNELYKHSFSELEKQWDAAVQRKPREGETAEQIAAEQQGQRDEGGFFDIEVELVEEGDAMPDLMEPEGPQLARRNALVPNPVEPEGLARRQALIQRIDRELHGEDLPQMNGENNRDADANQEIDEAVRGAQRDVEALREQIHQAGEQINQVREVGEQLDQVRQRRARPNGNGWEIRQNISTAQIASTVMGALFFPAISSIMGDLLKFALPAKWVTKESGRWGVKVSGGMLKEKWGRSIIGGCLFVVLKDAVTLYVKWKKARDFGKKKVLDYVGERRGAA